MLIDQTLGPDPLQETGGTKCLSPNLIGNLFYGFETNIFSLFYSFGTSYQGIALMSIGKRLRNRVLVIGWSIPPVVVVVMVDYWMSSLAVSGVGIHESSWLFILGWDN